MSELLSGSDTERPAGRFAFFPSDRRQTLRVRRFLMAAATSLLVCVVLFAAYLLGQLALQVAIAGTATIVALILLFYALFRSGLNLRFADPSLTAEQAAAAILVLAYLTYHLGPLREALDAFYMIALMFGVLRLSTKRLLGLAVLALAAHGVMLYMSYVRDPAMDLRVALTQYVILAIVLPWFAVLGGYVSGLRTQISGSHRELRHAFDRIEQQAIRDELTGAHNRRFLMEMLLRERSRAERSGTAFSVCLFDLDHFKAINDARGHAAGDDVLKGFAKLASRGLRAVDVFGRFGGEEFLLILPATDRDGAAVCAQRVRQRLESHAFAELGGGSATVTAGIATYRGGEELAALLARADEALYQGKAQGRNCVVAIG
jgi:diguanylate cyclase (GGDEF)-like protein